MLGGRSGHVRGTSCVPALPAAASLAEWLDAVRGADPLAGASVRNQTWFPRKIAIECESLWNEAGEALRHRPLTYDILEFVPLSGKGAGV